MVSAVLLGTADAQIGASSAPLLSSPLMSGAKRGSGGLYTLPDGTRVLLRERSGFLTGVSIVVRYPSSDAKVAGPAVQRGTDLVGLATGFGPNLASAVNEYLRRPEISPRLPEGVDGFAPPYQIRAQTKNQVLTIDVTMTRIASGRFIPTKNVIQPKKPVKSPVVLRIFSDFQCPYCRQFETQTFPELLKVLPDDVRVEFHHLPLEQIHPAARPAAEAAECAAQQGNFWGFKDALFQDIGWQTANPNPLFIAVADKLNLNRDAFRNCLAERRGKAAVDAALNQAVALGINSTPSLFINGYRVASAYDIQGLLRLIKYARTVDAGTTP